LVYTRPRQRPFLRGVQQRSASGAVVGLGDPKEESPEENPALFVRGGGSFWRGRRWRCGGPDEKSDWLGIAFRHIYATLLRFFRHIVPPGLQCGSRLLTPILGGLGGARQVFYWQRRQGACGAKSVGDEGRGKGEGRWGHRYAGGQFLLRAPLPRGGGHAKRGKNIDRAPASCVGWPLCFSSLSIFFFFLLGETAPAFGVGFFLGGRNGPAPKERTTARGAAGPRDQGEKEQRGGRKKKKRRAEDRKKQLIFNLANADSRCSSTPRSTHTTPSSCSYSIFIALLSLMRCPTLSPFSPLLRSPPSPSGST